MKIRQLNVEGFCSLKSVEWHPGDLNVIIGPNGSGKSNLLRLLEMIKASAESRLSKHILNSGGIDAILWDGKVSEIKLSMNILASSLYNRKYTDELMYKFNMDSWFFDPSYQIERESFDSWVLKKKNELDSPLIMHLQREVNAAKLLLDDKSEPFEIPKDQINPEETLLSTAARGLIFASFWIRPFHNYLLNLSIYQNIRVDYNATIRQPTVTRVERLLDPDGQNLIPVLHTLYTGDRDFKQSVNAAMRAAFGDDFDELVFPPASDQRIQLRVRWKSLSREQSAADLSDGTLRFLFLLAVLANPNPAPLIAIDEPETGLHPSMFPIIAEYAVEASKKTQVILTTHSDQFLDAFGDTRPTTTVAQWVDGETTLRTLDGDELDYWLKEYTLGSLFRSGELERMACSSSSSWKGRRSSRRCLSSCAGG